MKAIWKMFVGLVSISVILGFFALLMAFLDKIINFLMNLLTIAETQFPEVFNVGEHIVLIVMGIFVLYFLYRFGEDVLKLFK